MNGANASLCLDVSNGSRKDGANVQVYTKNGTDAQVWQVSTRADGSRQISSRFTGKCVDVANDVWENGTNVRMWTDNDSRAQSWDIVDSGSTMTIDGTSHVLWQVVQRKGSGWLMELLGNSGFTDGTNVVISKGTAADQKWAFVPVPRFQSGGVYELLLRLDPRFAMDVSGYSKANGASVILAGRSGANNQKYYFHQRSGDQWTIRNINSGRYLQVSNGVIASDGTQDVTQWADSEPAQARWQWRPESFGTFRRGGVEREVVKLYSWVTGDANTYCMDANQHSKLDLGNICVCGTDPDLTGQYSQEWILVPTTATDPTMPIPSGFGWATYVGQTTMACERVAAERLYPTWHCIRAWSASGPNHYEWRWSRKYADHLGRWHRDGDPIDELPWEVANVTNNGERAWVTEGLPATYDASKYKCMGYDVQVRCVGAGETATLVGNEASFELRAMAEPAVTLSNAGFSPEGLRFDYTSDYAGGTTSIRIANIYLDGVDLLAHLDYTVHSPLDDSGSILVDIGRLSKWPHEGDEITVRWYDGTDLMNEFPTLHTATLTVAYDTGHGATLAPTVTNGAGRTLKVTLSPHYATERVWFSTESDGLVEVERASDGSFYAEYPFGEDVEVWATGKSNDGDTWGVWNETYDASTVGGKAPCHAWNWDGGSFLLEVRRDEPLETDYTVRNDTETVSLNGRPWESVLLGGTSQSVITAVGSFGHPLDALGLEATRNSLDALVRQGHVRYRSPHGLRCDVCVTDARMNNVCGVWTAEVTMRRETP